MSFTFAQMNPDFSGAYVAIADDDISTVQLFDSKALLFDYVIQKLEIEGFAKVQSTVIDGNGCHDSKLNSKAAVYELDEDNCYKFGPIEPVMSQSIKCSYITL